MEGCWLIEGCGQVIPGNELWFVEWSNGATMYVEVAPHLGVDWLIGDALSACRLIEGEAR